MRAWTNDVVWHLFQRTCFLKESLAKKGLVTTLSRTQSKASEQVRRGKDRSRFMNTTHVYKRGTAGLLRKTG